jgi:hypothetical protein
VKEKGESFRSLSNNLSKAESELVLLKESQSVLQPSLDEQNQNVKLLQDSLLLLEFGEGFSAFSK